MIRKHMWGRDDTPSSIPSLIELLQCGGVSRSALGFVICRRLQQLGAGNVTLALSCPQPSAGEYDPNVAVQFRVGTSPSLTSVAHQADTYITIDDFPGVDLDPRGWLKPKIFLYGGTIHDLSYEERMGLIKFTSDFLTRLIQKERMLIRRALVNARAQSDDLNSFLHKALRSPELRQCLGFESASVFIADPMSQMLRLRGTTGLASRDIRKSEIAFSPEGTTKVGKVFTTQMPIVEYDSRKALKEGTSAEKTKEGQWARIYWPLQLQQLGEGDRRVPARTPVLGVVRTVNLSWADKVRLPPTWIELAATEFFAESLYNVAIGFVDAEEASFRKEEAFHAAGGVVDSITGSADRLSQWIFGEQFSASSRKIAKRFELKPLDASADVDNVRHFLRSVYAVALALGFQIERADLDVAHEPDAITSELMTRVILRALEMLPYIADAHSVDEKLILPDVGSILGKADYPPAVRGSPDALTSVFLNIFENAVKYRRIGEPCRIDVDFETTPKSVVVRVRDRGIGIKDQDSQRIFTRGYRSEEAKRHAKRGSGLGLHWCAEVLHRFGGDISATRESKGLTITITLARADGHWLASKNS